MTTFFFFLLANSRMISVPLILVSMVRTGLSHDQFYAHRCRQVKDHVAAIHQLRRHRHIHDGVDGVVKIRIRFQMKDILDGTGWRGHR